MAARIAIEPWPDVRLTSDTEADIGENGLDGGHIHFTISAPTLEQRHWIGQLVGRELGEGHAFSASWARTGLQRDLHHRFVLGGGVARGVRIERAGRLAGYAYISSEGHVGPLGRRARRRVRGDDPARRHPCMQQPAIDPQAVGGSREQLPGDERAGQKRQQQPGLRLPFRAL